MSPCTVRVITASLATCVEATMRDAYFIDYYMTLVVTSSEVIAVWQRTPAQTTLAAELLTGS